MSIILSGFWKTTIESGYFPLQMVVDWSTQQQTYFNRLSLINQNNTNKIRIKTMLVEISFKTLIKKKLSLNFAVPTLCYYVVI